MRNFIFRLPLFCALFAFSLAYAESGYICDGDGGRIEIKMEVQVLADGNTLQQAGRSSIAVFLKGGKVVNGSLVHGGAGRNVEYIFNFTDPDDERSAEQKIIVYTKRLHSGFQDNAIREYVDAGVTRNLVCGYEIW